MKHKLCSYNVDYLVGTKEKSTVVWEADEYIELSGKIETGDLSIELRHNGEVVATFAKVYAIRKGKPLSEMPSHY